MKESIEKRLKSLGSSFRLTFKDETFFENVDKRQVTCVANCVLRYLCGKGIEIPFRAKGCAKCAPEDGYTYWQGSEIARARMENDAYRQAKEMVNDMLDDYAKTYRMLAGAAISFETRTADVLEHNKKYIDEMADAGRVETYV